MNKQKTFFENTEQNLESPQSNDAMAGTIQNFSVRDNNNCFLRVIVRLKQDDVPSTIFTM